jgi:hypothetical protein
MPDCMMAPAKRLAPTAEPEAVTRMADGPLYIACPT